MKRFKVGNRDVGGLADGVFRKEVDETFHLFRKIDGWGIDEKVLKELPENTKIIIYDKRTFKTYATTRESYIDFGRVLHFKDKLSDYGTQIILERTRFDTTEPSSEEKERLEYLKTFT
jgi:hypothetical protein